MTAERLVAVERIALSRDVKQSPQGFEPCAFTFRHTAKIRVVRVAGVEPARDILRMLLPHDILSVIRLASYVIPA